MTIPKIFHHIWLGPQPLLDDLRPHVDTWAAKHPDWQHILWTEETLPTGLRREVYERLRSPAERSDILRLELLLRHGGVYIDTDFECLQPIDELIDRIELFAAEYKNGRVNNAILGAAADHQVIRRALAEVRPLARFGTVDKDGTGPFFIDRMLRGSGATVFARDLFYPTWSERQEAYAFHHMARSWKDKPGYEKSIMLAKRRLTQLAMEDAQSVAHARAVNLRFRVDDLAARVCDKARRVFQPRLTVATARMYRPRSGATRIPKLLHHVWLEPGPLPDLVAAHLATWRLRNPEWQQRLWREADLPSPSLRVEALDPLRSPAEREELLRLELVFRYGGVAADLALASRRSLAPAIEELEAFAGSTGAGTPDSSLVGAIPEHPAIKAALDAARPYEWHDYPAGRTGSEALEHSVAYGLSVLEHDAFARRPHAPSRDALAIRLRSLEARVRAKETARETPADRT